MVVNGCDVVLAVPIERNIHQQAFWRFIQLAQLGFPFIGLPYMRTDIVRNRHAEALLKSKFTHILMLDSDQVHPVDIVQRLTRWVKDDPAKQVISALYFRRGEPHDPLAIVRDKDGVFYNLTNWEKGLLQVDVVGSGCLLVAREVFEKIPGPPWFFYDYDYVKDGGWPTEDITFCHLCARYGIKIYVDTTTESAHLTDELVTEATFRRYMLEHSDIEILDIKQEANNAGNNRP